jgi:ABC-type transport system involved in cytochrome bd biosynthesis fused ATPase/permease subunit
LQECLLGLLASKTVIYVTHQVEFLPAADLILVSFGPIFFL